MDQDIIFICNNVPGAMQVIKQMKIKKLLTKEIISLMKSDEKLQGSNLWILYKKCNRDIHAVIINLQMRLLSFNLY